MTQPPQGWRWRPAPGWPSPAAGWSPPPGWEPDPTWPPAPEGWTWWEPGPPPGPTKGKGWLLAAGAVLLASFVLLVVGLAAPSLALVYLSVLCSVGWLPLLVVGLVRLVRSRSAQ